MNGTTSLNNSPRSATMSLFPELSAGDQIGPSQSSHSVPSVGGEATFSDPSIEEKISLKQHCDKSRRRAFPMRLRIPLQDLWSFRRIRKQRKKSQKAETDDKSSGHEIERGKIADSLSNRSSNQNLDQNRHDFDVNLTCPVCFHEKENDRFPRLLMCEHRCCFDCLRNYISTEICDSRVNITCPECPKMIHPNDIRFILNDVILTTKYELFMLRRHLTCEPDTRWCPAADCNYGVIAAGCASCPRLECERPGCATSFCYHCRQKWHPNKTCDDARTERVSLIMKASNSEELQPLDTKPCPRCNAMIAKCDDGSCNHMTCVICGAEFCWLCMKQISDLHYLSPSGCTFWGKKPWSRKKKVLWQIGTLIGAPLGIALIAGLTIPAMMIGIPIYVGRKLFKRYNTTHFRSKSRRNVIVVVGVTASIIVAPVLAALTVSVGVPILLAYVYGVVPISLCRTGGCGITKTENGVRLDMDEQFEGAAMSAYARGDSVGTISSSKSERKLSNSASVSATVASGNSSGWDLRKIGTSDNGDADSRKSVNTRKLSILSENATEEESRKIGSSNKNGMSASIVHIERENDCVSNTAIAGESLTGSICGSTGYNPTFKIRKNSIGSDSMNFSLCDNVSNITYPESLAGAIIDTNSSCNQNPNCSTVTEEGTFDREHSAVKPSVDLKPKTTKPKFVHSQNAKSVSGQTAMGTSAKHQRKTRIVEGVPGRNSVSDKQTSKKPQSLSAATGNSLSTPSSGSSGTSKKMNTKTAASLHGQKKSESSTRGASEQGSSSQVAKKSSFSNKSSKLSPNNSPVKVTDPLISKSSGSSKRK